MPKYIVGCGIEKTFEAEDADKAVELFIKWLSGEGCAFIDIREVTKKFKPKGG